MDWELCTGEGVIVRMAPTPTAASVREATWRVSGLFAYESVLALTLALALALA